MAEYKDLKYNEEIGPVKSAEADNLQKALSSMGYYTTKEDGTPLSFDGAFGKYTSAAVSDFAKDYGINYTGTVSSDLYNAILTEANNRKNGTTSTTVGEQTGYNALYKNAQDYKNSAYENALNQQSASYRAAMEARQEAEALAEIQRKRGVVDASTMAEQQKATYGANAEQVGRMGLQVSGYSDYLNSQAYAAGMAGRQAANAQATDIKRQALYQEAIARLDADKAYSQATAEADKTYYGMMNEIEAAKIEDEKKQETAQQTAYGNVIKGIMDGYDAESMIAVYGLTDDTLKTDAKKFETNYGTKIVTEDEKQEALEKQYQYEQEGKLVEAAKEAAKANGFAEDSAEYKIFVSEKISEQFNGIYSEDGTLLIDKAKANNLLSIIEKNPDYISTENKNKFIAAYEETFNSKYKTVNIFKDNFAEQVGYLGDNNPSSKQYTYVNEIRKAAEDEVKTKADNKGEYPEGYSGLKVGDIVDMNYGNDLIRLLQTNSTGIGISHFGSSYYVYKGNGIFERVGNAFNNNKVSALNKAEGMTGKQGSLYIPDNYYIDALGRIKENK